MPDSQPDEEIRGDDSSPRVSRNLWPELAGTDLQRVLDDERHGH